MSRIITNTNIIVDDFDFCKSFAKGTFVHFLTHFHSDHYEGLTSLWNYGTIYCSYQTKKFLSFYFPKLQKVIPLPYYSPQNIQVKPNLFVEVCLFDAKHIPGSAMILFRGYMGTILFTGDFRYNFSMITENHILFPPKIRLNAIKEEEVENMGGISIQVDEMIFDNTYCNKHFKFGKEEQIVKLMIEIIERNKEKKVVYIAMGALGKHAILLKLSKYFQTSIVVSERQFKKIQLAGLSTQFLTTSIQQGYIQLISKKNRAKILEQTKKSQIGDDFICIDTDFLMLQHQSPDQINYIVPYSLHSNFKQMETFIKMVAPCILRKLVIPYSSFKSVKRKIKVNHRLKFAKYLDYLQSKVYKSQSGYAFLVRNYTQIYKLSAQYLGWFSSKRYQKLEEVLEIGDQDHNLRKRKMVMEESETMKKRERKESLKQIADSLNAVHKNKSLERSLQDGKKFKLKKQYFDMFEKRQSERGKSE